MMECREIQEKLSPYLEGAVSSGEKGLIEGHINVCAQCRTALEDLKRAGHLVKGLEEVEPPPWMKQKIMARVRAEEEKKKGIFRKLFYPLRIKVPLEALATVFIALIAVYVFKAVEPEMKPARLPAAPGPIIAREEAPKPLREPEAGSRAMRDQALRKQHPQKESANPVSTPGAGVGEAKRKEERPLPPKPAEQPRMEEKKEPRVTTSGESEKAGGALKEQETSELRAASRPAPQEGQSMALSRADRNLLGRRKPAAPAKVKDAAAMKSAPIDIALRVHDAAMAGNEVEKILGQLGAGKIERESLEGKEVLTADLKGKKMEELLEKLKSIGEVGEKGPPPEIPEGDIAIRIEIAVTP